MTLNDIFKNEFIEQTTGALSMVEMVLTFMVAFLIGVGIFYIYKKTFQGVIYSKTFNISLVILSLISATIIIGVTNNIVLSLGMVGALSIVRFRTSIKDPIDVVYMFWSIGSGIIVGAGLYVLGILSFVMIGLVLIAFNRIDVRLEPYLLIIGYENKSAEQAIYEKINGALNQYKIKSKTKVPGRYELTVEIRTKIDKTSLVDELDQIEGVSNVAMLSYDGDFSA
ncbi:MAG: DUF4956 domain-containing protein [Clostridia bacterium]|nr:DUF4956 domain-containing protein [Clostridia bacterium]